MTPRLTARTLLASAMLLSLGASPLASAEPAAQKAPASKSGSRTSNIRTASPMEENLRRIGLKDEQIEQVKVVQEEAKGQTAALRSSILKKQRELLDYLSNATATETEAITKSQQLQQMRAKLEEIRIQTWFKLRGLMSQEQFQQFASSLQERQGARPTRKSAPQSSSSSARPTSPTSEPQGE